MFLTARNVFCNQLSNGCINFYDIKNRAAMLSSQVLSNILYNRYIRLCDCMKCEYCILFDCAISDALPFFDNYSYALDVHEVVRELTCFNIGEPSSTFGHIINKPLYDFTTKLLLSVFGHSISENNFSRNDRQLDEKKSYINIIFNHLELGE